MNCSAAGTHFSVWNVRTADVTERNQCTYFQGFGSAIARGRIANVVRFCAK